MRAIKFYKNKNKTDTPDDSYVFDWDSPSWGFVVHNWLMMHPDGKVEFCNELVTPQITPPEPWPRR